MKSLVSHFPDPFLCSCFPTSSYSIIGEKWKWATSMIILALLIVVSQEKIFQTISFCTWIIYLSSGLYALLDVMEISSDQFFGYKHGTNVFHRFRIGLT